MTEQDPREWHLDKRVPIALILGMIGQVAVVVWVAAVMFKDIETNRNNISAINEIIIPLQQNANTTAVQVGRMEQSIEGIRADTNRILDILERGFQQ